jgi:hypothetical protein
VEWADRLAQAELPDSERRAREAERNVLAARPSGAAIACMDRVLEWLQVLRAHDAELALTITIWAFRAARRRSVRAICRERGWKVSTFYYQRKCALGFLAKYLTSRGVAVF